jgi:hypothetical protein
MLGNFQFFFFYNVDSSSYKSSKELIQLFKIKNSKCHTHSNFQNVPKKRIANFLEKSNFKLIEIKTQNIIDKD